MRSSLHYKLKEFEAGDVYLGTADRERFTIIDNQLSFLTDQIGDGVISGWQLISTGGTGVRVKSGLGIIEKFATETYGYYDFDLEDNHRWYFFIRRKQDVVADKSAFSQMASLSYVDSTPPATPAQPTVVEVTYNSIELSWTANTEPDFSRYEVWRSTNGISYGSEPVAAVTTNTFTDTDVTSDTQYWYKLLSYDENDLTNGIFSTVRTATTDDDERVPSDPTNVDIVNGDRSLQVVWDAGAFLVDSYSIVVQPIDTEDLDDGSPATYSVSKTTFFLILKELTNGQNYKITIKSVSPTGVESDGVVVKGQPIFTGGPREIDSFVYSDFAIDSSWNVAINLSWSLQTDEYHDDPAYYIVTIQQGSESGDPTIYLTNSIIIQRYTVGGVERKIREKTRYTIRVQTVNSEGEHSIGYLIRIQTSKFSPPGPPTNLAIDSTYTLIERAMTVEWRNTTTEFSYNTLTMTKQSLVGVSPPVTTVFANRNVGQQESYSVPRTLIVNQYLYTFILKSNDSYGNVSDSVSVSLPLNINLGNTFGTGVGEITGARPPAPDGISSISGNDMVSLYWNRVISDNLAEYRIWRADFTVGAFASTDFVALGTTTKTKFTDYDVENGSSYYYFVTSIDIFDQESLNPNDLYLDYTFAAGQPRSHSLLGKPPALTLTPSGHDLEITWDADTDTFDGFEVWRSIGDKTSFEKIGTTDSFSTSYLDENSLHKSGTYYYMIRKFTDEAEFLISRTRIVPIGALQLGYADVASGSVTVNEDAKIDLALLADPIADEVTKQFQSKTHIYMSTHDDRRVRLGDNLVVEDWQSTDFKNYTSETDIRATNLYIAYVNNLQTGVSSVINRDTGILTFEDPIYDPVTQADEAEPTVVVVFLDTSEVDGILKEENIGSIIADKVSKGKVPKDALRQIDHFGRYREPCLPVKVTATRQTGTVYTATTPTGIAFYDILTLPSGQILAATSEGVRLSDADDGTAWDSVLLTNLPATKLYKSDVYDWYIVLAGDEVYYSESLTDWVRIPGISGGNILRDIVEDNAGNIYVSSDSGVYRINPDRYIKVAWEQCDIIDPINNSAYALDFSGGYVVASVASGLFRTNDEGEIWTQVSGSEIQVPIFSIVHYSGYTFLVSNNRIWRKLSGAYDAIASFPYSIRKLVIFNGDIYVTTDKGLYRSDPTQDIFVDTQLRFSVGFKSLQRNGLMPSVYALREIESHLFMGMDERIYSSTETRRLSLHANVQGICPILYVDGQFVNVGVYYSNRNAIMFDTRREPTASVEITSAYTEFTLLNGGWADTKYDAELTLVLNGADQPAATPVHPLTTATYISQQTKLIVTPFFNARTANFNKAFKYLTELVQFVDQVDTAALLTPTESVSATLVSDIYRTVNLLKVNLSPEVAETVILPPIGGSVTTESGISYEYDVVNGTLTITTGVTKFTQVALSIEGVALTGTGTITHKEIDDQIESINSGLPASLASVQQTNLIKLGIYNHIIDPSGLEARNALYQSKYFAACDDWYDTLASTVDYTLELEQSTESANFSINYPADVLYLPDEGEVWVCGSGGIIAVDTSTYECTKILQTEFYFFNMSLSGGTVYALAEDGLYLINASTKAVTKDVNLELPEGYTSVLVFGDTVYIATTNGLYFHRPYELQWTKLFDITNALVRSGQQLTFALGQDPNSNDVSVVYYSHGGVVWNRSTQLEGYVTSGATQRGDSIYYATNKGLIVEDLSKLFAEGDGGPAITAVDLDGDDDPDEITINSVDADADAVFAVTTDGNWYKMGGNYVFDSGTSRMGTIHKVKVIEGQYWFFADNLIDIESAPHLIQLTTGKALI